MIDEYWWTLWGDQDRPTGVEEWLHWVKDLPPFPKIRPLTAKRVWSELQGACPSKAPGFDGWRISELRNLPKAYSEAIAELFNTVDEKGDWPESMKTHWSPCYRKVVRGNQMTTGQYYC